MGRISEKREEIWGGGGDLSSDPGGTLGDLVWLP